VPIPLETRDIEAPSSGDDTQESVGALAGLDAVQRELRQRVHHQLRLAALELRLAARSLMTMIAAAVFMGVLLVLAWAGLMGAVGLEMAAIGFAPGSVMLVLSLLTLLLIVLVRSFIRRRSYLLGFPATLRTLDPTGTPAQSRGEP
jgi:hypothetical protein